MAHPNEELARKGYKAFSAGDMDTVRTLFAEDIIWHVPGRNPLSGDYKGQGEVFVLFAKTMEMTKGTFKLEVHDILANDQHIVTLVVASGQRDGKRMEDRQAHVSHVENGKITEFWLHPGDQYAVDEFWA
jgi:hypothetical protein